MPETGVEASPVVTGRWARPARQCQVICVCVVIPAPLRTAVQGKERWTLEGSGCLGEWRKVGRFMEFHSPLGRHAQSHQADLIHLDVISLNKQ